MLFQLLLPIKKLFLQKANNKNAFDWEAFKYRKY